MITRTDGPGIRSTVSERGQVVIPKPLRDRLGIRPGQQLDFREERGCLVAVKVAPEDPTRTVYGILRAGRSTDERMNELRGATDTIDPLPPPPPPLPPRRTARPPRTPRI